MVELIIKKLLENRMLESMSLEEILYESLSTEDLEKRNKELEVGDVILTKYYSRRSNQSVSPHRVMIITRINKNGKYTQYEGYPLKSDRGKSNRYSDKYPNSLGIKDYSTILVPGEDVPYTHKEAFIDVQDLARFRSYDILPKESSYAGHVTDEFFEFVKRASENYKRGSSNQDMKWEK